MSADDGLGALTVAVASDGGCHLVQLTGELDLAGRSSVFGACTAPEHCHVVIDMSNLTFMDCAGYGALHAARRELEGRGGGLTFMNVTGEPAHLLDIIESSARSTGSAIPG